MSFHLVAEAYREPVFKKEYTPFFVVGGTYRITIDGTKVPSYMKKKSMYTGTLVHLPNVMNASSQGREIVYTVSELEQLGHLPLDQYTGRPRIVLLTLMEEGQEHYFTMDGPLPNGYVSSIIKI